MINLICHSELESFPVFKDFADKIDSDINKCAFFFCSVHNEKCQIWKICKIQ